MISCSITTSVLGCMVTLYLFFRYTWCLTLSPLSKAAIFALFILAGCIPLLVSYNLENLLGRAYPFYRHALYYIFISCIILFSFTLLADAIFWLLSYTPLLGKLKIFCGSLNYILIALAFISGAYALYAGLKVPAVKEISLTSDKIKTAQKIVVLSDLHIHRVINPEKVRNIVAKTNALNPDIILLDGDIIDDDVTKVSSVSALLKDLKAKNGIYFVTGNHEFYAGYRDSVDELQKLGFRFLENDGVSVNQELYLAGIPDLFSGKSYGKEIDLSKAFAGAKAEQFKLLMSHTPADFGPNNHFDLEVSGHTHGGQIFPFHILTKLHNKYLAGLYQMDGNAQIYVTRGAGQWGPQMRFLAPSEITIINLTPTIKGKEMKKSEIDTIFKQGESNPYGQFFTGQTYLNMLSVKDDIWNSSIGNVTFEPKARTNWHKHSGGQILLVTNGEGRYQERGKDIQILHKGDVVRIAPDVEHWHGAAPDQWFTHISIETNLPDNKSVWLEPVTDKEYK